nr:glycosyltransferase family 4 protein [Armatimonas rosea]
MEKKYIIGFHDESKGLGGTTRYLLELVDGLNRDKYYPVFFSTKSFPWHQLLKDSDVELITPDTIMDSLGEVTKINHSATITRKRLSWVKIPHLVAWTLGMFKEKYVLEELFNRKTVDLLHTNHAGAEIAPIAMRRVGVPRIVATWHVDSTYDLDGNFQGKHYRYLERQCMNSIDHVISVSEATKNDWVNRCGLNEEYEKRISVVYNGVDVDAFTQEREKSKIRLAFGLPGNDKFILGSLGRLDKAKGFMYLIEALPKIRLHIPNILVVIAGSGPLKEELIEQAQRLGVADCLIFLGFVRDTHAFLEMLDVYVQPSLCEAHPFGTLEAGAMGLPIVASAVGGIPETIVDGETGFLVPAKNVASLAEKICILGQNSSLCQSMGEKGRKRIQEKFTSQKMVNETVEIYERLLMEKPYR